VPVARRGKRGTDLWPLHCGGVV